MSILTAALLRRHKGFYLDLAGVHRHLHKGKVEVIPIGINKGTILPEETYVKLPHVTICLLENSRERQE